MLEKLPEQQYLDTFVLKNIEMTPKSIPCAIAYAGTVICPIVGLNTVASLKIKPIIPMIAS